MLLLCKYFVQFKGLLEHVELALKKQHSIKCLGLLLNERLDLSETGEVVLVGSLDYRHPVKRDERLQPEKDGLLFAELLRLEFDHDLLEQSADQLAIVDA